MKMRTASRRKHLKLLRKKQVGDSMNMDCWLGILMTSRFVDPTVIPEVEQSPDLRRTTLVKRGGSWLMPEYCESMNEKEELGEQFFDDDAVIPSITTSSSDARGFGILCTRIQEA